MPPAEAGGRERGVLRLLVQGAEEAARDVGAVRGVGVPVLVAQAELVGEFVDVVGR
ncbi:hypothetical protein [Streptomyces sp. HUAS ZL42]|uniref:hypothetical protein n=1 Tax=Streptomyces sp. HUAS ZL42 TaxID=3231715 RepID=UPI00345EB699